MLIENTREEAMKAFLNGRKVRVLMDLGDGSWDVDALEGLLPEEDFHYLVDVPDCENPQLEQSSEETPVSVPVQEAPEVGAVAPKEKTKKEIVLELAEKGLSTSEIAKQTGIKYSTVYAHLNPEKCNVKKPVVEKPKIEVTPGHNADLHLCKSCKFRSKNPKINGCDYVLIAKRGRGCETADCNRYEKGEPKKRIESISM